MKFLFSLISLLLVSCGESSSPAADHSADTDFILWSDGRLQVFSENSEYQSKFFQPLIINSTVTTGLLSWEVAYEDLNSGSLIGFADPREGAERRLAFEDAVRIVGETLRVDRAVTVQIRVNRSKNQNTSRLASAATGYPPNPFGFMRGHLGTHILTGIDPEPNGPDLDVQFNFFHKFHTGEAFPPPSKTDLRSVGVHEIGHAIGFASLIDSSGRSLRTGGNPGVFTTYDALLGSSSGGRLMSQNGLFTGTRDDLNGRAGGELSWLGPLATSEISRRPLIHTPSVFDQGTSISHFSLTEAPAVMRPEIPPGVSNRLFAPFEIRALIDLGYINARSPDDGLLAFDKRISFQSGRVLSSTIVTRFDEDNEPDLLVLEDGASGSTLRVYSGLATSGSLTYDLNERFIRMSVTKVGPSLKSGIVLTSSSGVTLLSLGGLTKPIGRDQLTREDFEHIHRVKRLAPSSSSLYKGNPVVPLADMNNDGNIDVVTFPSDGGVTTFFGDSEGQFDHLTQTQRYPNLNRTNPAIDLSAFTGRFVFNQPELSLEVAHGFFGSGGKITRFNPDGNTQTQHRLVNPIRDHRIRELARFNDIGFVALHSDQSNDTILAKINLEADTRFRLKQLDVYPQISGMEMVNDPNGSPIPSPWFTTGTGNTIEYIPRSGSSPQRVAGSIQGYNDGEPETALFNRPAGICSSNDAVYVADIGNGLIRRIDLLTNEVTTVTGVLGQRAYRDGPKGTASFFFRGAKPGVCAVINDSLFILDGRPPTPSGPYFTIEIRKVNLETGYVTTLPTPDYLGASSPFDIDVWGQTLFILHRAGADTFITSSKTVTDIGRTFSETTPHPVDIDQDGFMDLLVSTNPTSRVINYRRGDGEGNYKIASQTQFPEHPHSLETLNIAGNSKPDMLVGLTNSIRSYIYSNGDFIEDRTRRIDTKDSSWMKLVDADNNGQLDIAWIDIHGDLRIVLADNTGNWVANGPGTQGEHFRKPSGVGSPTWFDLADIDNDADLDFLIASDTNDNIAYFEGIIPPN